VVEVKGERVLTHSCCRKPSEGMEVATDSARALASQKMVLELLLSDANVWTLIVLALAIGSTASVAVDIKQAVDGSDSAAKPPLLE